MDHLIQSVRQAVAQENWYAALGLALALPDICGYAEDPTAGSQRRYVAWCTDYLVPKYTDLIGPHEEEHVFLSGEDCYALRCAFLHEGADEIVNQRARRALESFIFVAPRPGRMRHCNQIDGILQLQVDLFCEDLCASVEEWFGVARQRHDVQTRLGQLMKIEGGFAL